MPSAARSAQKILCASFFLSAASSVEWPMMNSAVLMNSEPKHYLTACPLSFRWTRAACPELVERVAHFRPDRAAPSSFSRVMKQILLCVTAMVAEVLLCERPKTCRVQSSRSRKILFPQHPLDPDVDREGA